MWVSVLSVGGLVCARAGGDSSVRSITALCDRLILEWDAGAGGQEKFVLVAKTSLQRWRIGYAARRAVGRRTLVLEYIGLISTLNQSAEYRWPEEIPACCTGIQLLDCSVDVAAHFAPAKSDSVSSIRYWCRRTSTMEGVCPDCCGQGTPGFWLDWYEFLRQLRIYQIVNGEIELSDVACGCAAYGFAPVYSVCDVR